MNFPLSVSPSKDWNGRSHEAKEKNLQIWSTSPPLFFLFLGKVGKVRLGILSEKCVFGFEITSKLAAVWGRE